MGSESEDLDRCFKVVWGAVEKAGQVSVYQVFAKMHIDCEIGTLTVDYESILA